MEPCVALPKKHNEGNGHCQTCADDLEIRLESISCSRRVLTADIGSHVDTFLELVADADDNDGESVVDVVDMGGNFDSAVIGLVCLHQCPIVFKVELW